VALAELRIHAATGIANYEHFAAKGAEDAHRQGNLLERISFVVMKASFHRDHDLSGKAAADEAARMGLDCSLGEVRDFLIGQADICLDILRKTSQAGAQNDADLRPTRPARVNELLRFLNLIV